MQLTHIDTHAECLMIFGSVPVDVKILLLLIQVILPIVKKLNYNLELRQ